MPKKSCEFISPWGRCRQTAHSLCWYHAEPKDRHDPYYHEKVVKGLVGNVAAELRDTDLEAMWRPRRHGDGRRSDQYVTEGD